MSNTVRVEVTSTDIALGERMDCIRCPVARAARRTSGLRALISGNVVTYPGDQWFILPSAVVEFVFCYDHELPVEPIAFDLPVPW